MTLLSLRAGSLGVDLAPRAGGSIVRFHLDGRDILRPMPAAALQREAGRESPCFPLVPFSNRIANGDLRVDGKAYHLPCNWPGVRHPMHGDGWACAWQVARADETSAELVLDHDGSAGWPFRYRAHQSVRLDPTALSLRLAIDNLEDRPVPAGLGLHPFFRRDEDTTLAFRAEAVWLADAEVLPTEQVAVPPAWNFAESRAVELGIDNCFAGWDGHAAITWPGRRLRLAIEASAPFRHAVVYTPADRSYFCVEPASHANGQVAGALLAAGATLAGTIVFRLSSL
ncbi:aldose 1-epimerase [Reyranella sp.]|uniref:aldose 1-epimerase n=1 Tax=Reyranella sp. TaxID=1929291 RepID=UPI003BAC855A